MLAGPKRLYLNHCSQPTLWLHDLCLKVLTVPGTELHLFRASDIAAVATTRTISYISYADLKFYDMF